MPPTMKTKSRDREVSCICSQVQRARRVAKLAPDLRPGGVARVAAGATLATADAGAVLGRASGTAAAPPGASPCRRRSRAGRHARSGLSRASHGAAGGGAAGGVGPWPAADVAHAPRSSRPPPLCRRRRGDPRPSPRHVALARGVPPFGGRPRQARSGRPPRRHVGGPPPSPSAAAVPSVPVVVTLFTPVRRSRSRSPPRPPHSPPPRPGGVRLHRATPQPIRTPSHPSSLPPSSSRAESEQRAEMPRAISPWPDRR